MSNILYSGQKYKDPLKVSYTYYDIVFTFNRAVSKKAPGTNVMVPGVPTFSIDVKFKNTKFSHTEPVWFKQGKVSNTGTCTTTDNTNTTCSGYCIMQSDGNLVNYIYNKDGTQKAVLAIDPPKPSFTVSNPYLKLEDTGELVVYNGDDKIIWRNNKIYKNHNPRYGKIKDLELLNNKLRDEITNLNIEIINNSSPLSLCANGAIKLQIESKNAEIEKNNFKINLLKWEIDYDFVSNYKYIHGDDVRNIKDWTDIIEYNGQIFKCDTGDYFTVDPRDHVLKPAGHLTRPYVICKAGGNNEDNKCKRMGKSAHCSGDAKSGDTNTILKFNYYEPQIQKELKDLEAKKPVFLGYTINAQVVCQDCSNKVNIGNIDATDPDAITLGIKQINQCVADLKAESDVKAKEKETQDTQDTTPQAPNVEPIVPPYIDDEQQKTQFNTPNASLNEDEKEEQKQQDQEEQEQGEDDVGEGEPQDNTKLIIIGGLITIGLLGYFMLRNKN